jgi:predicted membrane channel-forming protein YqfA (hemolysin III family)
MLLLSLALFVFAAVLGLIVVTALLKKKETSKPVALAHGAVGAAGLIALIFHAAKNPDRLLMVAIGLLVVAALGGAWLLANDLRRKPGPLFLVVVHVFVALAAVGTVAVVAFR